MNNLRQCSILRQKTSFLFVEKTHRGRCLIFWKINDLKAQVEECNNVHFAVANWFLPFKPGRQAGRSLVDQTETKDASKSQIPFTKRNSIQLYNYEKAKVRKLYPAGHPTKNKLSENVTWTWEMAVGWKKIEIN